MEMRDGLISIDLIFLLFYFDTVFFFLFTRQSVTFFLFFFSFPLLPSSPSPRSFGEDGPSSPPRDVALLLMPTSVSSPWHSHFGISAVPPGAGRSF